MKQYCRYCAYCTRAEKAYFCTAHLPVQALAAEYITHNNGCRDFAFTPLCILTGKEYRPREYRAKDVTFGGKQIGMEELLYGADHADGGSAD